MSPSCESVDFFLSFVGFKSLFKQTNVDIFNRFKSNFLWKYKSFKGTNYISKKILGIKIFKSNYYFHILMIFVTIWMRTPKIALYNTFN